MAVAFLILAAIVMSVLMMIAVILLVIIFGHPDDRNLAWLPRVVTIFGIWLAFMSLLILPYDVAATSSGGDSGGLAISTLWEIDFAVIAVMLSAIIPYAFFYYESEVDDSEPLGCCEQQWAIGLKYSLVFLTACVIVLVILYSEINEAHIPVLRIAQSTDTVFPANYSLVSSDSPLIVVNTYTAHQNTTLNVVQQYPCYYKFCLSAEFTWNLPVSFILYLIAFMAFVGWFFFTLFVGVGLFALPLDLINAFRTRPTPMSTKTYFEERQKLGERAKQMIELGKRLQEQQDKSTGGGVLVRSRERQELHAFEQNYFYLKKDYQILYVAHKLKGGNPLTPFAMLVLGILSIGVSISWYVHIAVFVLPARPFSQFLNTFFIKLSIPSFPLLGVLAFTIWSFYLIWCVVKGNFALGVRFLFWTLYPMELGGTMMNAFLFNTFFILLCSVPCVQFCIQAFPVYAAYTQANAFFGNQIRYLTFFQYFFVNNVFVYAILAISGLTIIVMSAFPKNRAASVEAQLDALAKSTNTSLHDYAEP